MLRTGWLGILLLSVPAAQAAGLDGTTTQHAEKTRDDASSLRQAGLSGLFPSTAEMVERVERARSSGLQVTMYPEPKGAGGDARFDTTFQVVVANKKGPLSRELLTVASTRKPQQVTITDSEGSDTLTVFKETNQLGFVRHEKSTVDGNMVKKRSLQATRQRGFWALHERQETIKPKRGKQPQTTEKHGVMVLFTSGPHKGQIVRCPTQYHLNRLAESGGNLKKAGLTFVNGKRRPYLRRLPRRK